MKINTQDLAKKLKQDPTLCIVDVRSPGEFKSTRISGSKNIPIEEIENRLDELKGEGDIYVMCHAGNRSQKACNILRAKGLNTIIDVEGGIQSWINHALPVEKTGTRHMPIMQQVLLIAGLLILTGTLGSLYLNTRFIYLSMAVGAGLTFAGATGKCYMSSVLNLMPWNR
jgi:rhodanese-related sulfurtransferase